MRVWRRSSDGRARHFKHIGDIGAGGSGGGAACESVAESDKHLKWKSLAASRLIQIFENKMETCELERALEAPVSSSNRRVGDVVLEFKSPDPQLGKGIVAEVQHKNVSKDIQGTTADYIAQEFAVVWLDKSDFAPDRCRLTEIDLRSRARDAVWPEHSPSSDDYPAYWHASQYILEDVRWKLGDTAIPARLPTEWFDSHAQRIWSEQTWESLFNPGKSEQFLLEAAIPSVDAARNTAVTFPPECVETLVYTNSDWNALFDDPVDWTENTPVELEIDLAPFFSTEFWNKAWYRGRDEMDSGRDDLQRPETLFDDVQCHSCGHYIFWEEAGKECTNCGETFDWLWNIRTGRISYESVPEHVDIGGRVER